VASVNLYKFKIRAIIDEGLRSYVSSNIHPEFCAWLYSKEIYYANRFSNEIMKEKPEIGIQVINSLKQKVENLKGDWAFNLV
jgi:hypothetical protein